MSDEAFKRKLTITHQEELARFPRKGEESILYSVEAITETGEKVTQKLRTFHPELPQGELIEFDVVPYDHPEHGRSYTLKLPSKGRASKKDISEVLDRLTKIADRVSALEGEVAELRARINRDAGLDEKFGKEPPF